MIDIHWLNLVLVAVLFIACFFRGTKAFVIAAVCAGVVLVGTLALRWGTIHYGEDVLFQEYEVVPGDTLTYINNDGNIKDTDISEVDEIKYKSDKTCLQLYDKHLWCFKLHNYVILHLE